MWERWNSFTLESGFGDVNMNSFNHYAYGAIAEWFYSGICGIQPLNNGFEHFLLKPVTDTKGRINRAKAVFRGIVSEWERDGDEVTYRFTVPTSATAVLRDDNAEGGSITLELTKGKHEIKVLEKLISM